MLNKLSDRCQCTSLVVLNAAYRAGTRLGDISSNAKEMGFVLIPVTTSGARRHVLVFCVTSVFSAPDAPGLPLRSTYRTW
jgi:hypothetical protein